MLNLKEPPASVIGWTITALEHMYNSVCSDDTQVNVVYSRDYTTEGHTDDVLNLSLLFVSQDNCLRLLARCLALIPVEKLESILRDTQVSFRQYC